MQIAAHVAQVADFQIFDQTTDLLFLEQQRGHGDDGDAVVGNAGGKIELGQDARMQQRGGEIVHHLDGGLAAGSSKRMMARMRPTKRLKPLYTGVMIAITISRVRVSMPPR